MNLKTVDLLSLQTKAMRDDEAVRGFSAALSEQIRKLAIETENVAIYSRIDELPENVLDVLAWQFNVSWYEIDSPLETKREAIKDALLIHKSRGTPYAVQRVVEIFFGGDATLEEWFEYDGDPYYFRITTSGAIPDEGTLEQFFRMIEKTKNLRSRLETVNLARVTPFQIYAGGLVSGRDSCTLSDLFLLWDDSAMIDDSKAMDSEKMFDDQDEAIIFLSYLFGLEG